MVCPRPNSGVYKLLDREWSLWVVFSGDNKKLTDGGCQYPRGRSSLDAPHREFKLATLLS
ncbi:MAG: hypothetical protein CFH40_00107 [Alphaproteobacteria bacterium MarineAlpha10_Bin3]|nr:MAG: hypothetical protein CFH40_00107 [Alphaproteobacteria bacterium MarineAlpha10_Bin3]PPR75555.1 MAG: hypothetical protein CFH09_00107 [Alphaproteobacteria bacterium MarineAlpha4_Bin1]